MVDWLHCNTCFRQPGDGGNYFLTCCGHVYCEQCGCKGWKEQCLLCGTRTPSAFKLTANMPSSVATYFMDPFPMLKKAIDDIKKVLPAIEFQQRERNRFVTHLHKTIKQQKEVVHKLNNNMRDKITVLCNQTEREKATLKEEITYLKEEIKYLKMVLREREANPRSSPSGDRHRPDSSNSPAIKANVSPFAMNRMSSSDVQKSMSANNVVTSGRICVRTPPSGGRMGTIPPSTPSPPSACLQQHYRTPKSVPHPINFGDWNMETSTR